MKLENKKQKPMHNYQNQLGDAQGISTKRKPSNINSNAPRITK
jgi:hypothetical protein